MIRKQGLLPIFFALGLSALFSQWVRADDHAMGPCAEDVKKFCADAKAGHNAVAACLNKHQAELSPACKADGENRKSAVQALRAACKEDQAKFCKDVEQGRGRVIRCLIKNETQVSAPCKQGLEKMKASRKKH